ncbi:hypothetical protein HKD37_01G001519 [Glycine soja]
MRSQFLSQMQSQGLALPLESEVGPSAACVNTKESCVDPLRNDPNTGDSDKCGLYVEENPPRLVALGRLYERSTTIQKFLCCMIKSRLVLRRLEMHMLPLLYPLKRLGAVGPAKPADRPDHDVDDHLYMMTLTIPQLFLKSLQVMWDATVFGVFNDNFPLYIKHEDVSEIAHSGQCLNISILQLWILAYWQMVVILPKENVVIWFCSLHNRLDNYLKGIINRSVLFFNTFALVLVGNINILIVQYASMFVFNCALKGLDDTPQSKSKATTRWIVVKYFNDARPLESERLKALRIQWAKYYLKVKNET